MSLRSISVQSVSFNILMGYTGYQGVQENPFYGDIINPIRAGGGAIYDPPLVFFYPHFSRVRARDLKFYDFLYNIKKIW